MVSGITGDSSVGCRVFLKKLFDLMWGFCCLLDPNRQTDTKLVVLQFFKGDPSRVVEELMGYFGGSQASEKGSFLGS